MRPDLFDAHTLHWHGFRNVIPFFDGEPTGSVSVPAGTVFRYVYRPRDPGTYMYHCHVEDVEHVHMGMNGLVFVRPEAERDHRRDKYLYNDTSTTGTTGSSRSTCRRCGPSRTGPTPTSSSPSGATTTPTSPCSTAGSTPTRVAPNAPFPTGWSETPAGTVVDGGGAPWTKPYMPVATDGDGNLVASRRQPDTSSTSRCRRSSTCNEGERVALRFSNLGFKEAAMTIDGIPMRVVGRDATLMRGSGPAPTPAT